MKPEELSKTEYEQQFEADSEEAINALKCLIPKDEKWFDTFKEWVISDSARPCIYNSNFRNATPFEWSPIKVRPLPATFREHPKYNTSPIHISLNPCPKLNMQRTVICYMKYQGKYYRCEHKIGKCPWKKTTN